jgi:outer membrane receptor for ferrienterochelin and colicins
MKLFITTLILLLGFSAGAQTLEIIVYTDEQVPIPGATVTWVNKNQSLLTDSTGKVVFEGLPETEQHFTISHVGFSTATIKRMFAPGVARYELVLEEEHEEEEEVIVTTTRTSRTITNTPTRVEIISGEELEEKGNMKPGDIRMMLNESTGIQTQQTSATSYNSSIRIQGLDGRYTQILRDGYPLYSGFPGGLSIMQIAPLDLRQVEVIKGSSSTLYGGGAIAGLVNLVSRTPGPERELRFLANGTSAGGLDLSGFYSSLLGKGKTGITTFISRNTTAPYDPADIGLTAIPKSERYTFNPRLFFYGDKTTADVGFSYIGEQRTGGNMEYVKGDSPQGYYESNHTRRFTGMGSIKRQFDDQTFVQFRNSFSRFDRRLSSDNIMFAGVQQSLFSELSVNHQREKAQWIGGLNYMMDDFDEEDWPGSLSRDYRYKTYGAFVQNTWQPVEKWVLETGLRGDYVKEYGFVLLPRLSALYRFSPNVTARLGGGFGYKTPTVFTEETERLQFQSVLPIDFNQAENERSVGGNFDIHYKTQIGEVNLSINQLFFYTRIEDPLVLSSSGAFYRFTNADGYMDTKGLETNIRFIYGDFKLFIGYTLADANTTYDGQEKRLPLTARHRLNNVLMFEKEESLKLGLEAYYTSRQQLGDGSFGRPYWVTGFMAEKLWEKFSIFLNFENFTDTRQTKFGPIYTGNISQPTFKDIYAPVDGFVVNGGIKISL